MNDKLKCWLVGIVYGASLQGAANALQAKQLIEDTILLFNINKQSFKLNHCLASMIKQFNKEFSTKFSNDLIKYLEKDNILDLPNINN